MAAVTTSYPSRAFIGGEHVDAASGETFDSLAPGTGTVLGQVASCDVADVDRAVRSARLAFESGVWSRMAPGRPQEDHESGSRS